MPAFNSLSDSFAVGTGWQINSGNSAGDILFLKFIAVPTRNSLVGLTGGSLVTPASDAFGNYMIASGSITPAPEPSSLVLFASGLLVLGLAWRFGKKVGHPLSA